MRGLQHFLLALQFFTRIPITGRLATWVGFSPAMLRESAAYFPVVGAVVALVAVGALLLSLQLLGATGVLVFFAVLASTAATMWCTGGFHEDGLADVADGLGGHVNPARAIEIMKDSRIGAYAALTLLCVVAAKIMLLGYLASHGWVLAALALWIAHIGSRYATLWLIRALPHVGDTATSKSKPLADQISTPALMLATVWSLLLLAPAGWALGWQASLMALVTAAAVTTHLGRWFERRIGGFTGDCLGANQQLCELAVYAGLVGLHSHGWLVVRF